MNRVFIDGIHNKSIHELFSLRARSNPAAVALREGDRKISFSELDLLSNKYASYLATLGITRGSLVAVHLDRSINLFAALIGIMKTGAAYVPIDPSTPAQRLSYILSDSKADYIITENWQTILPRESKLLTVNNILDHGVERFGGVASKPDDMLYVMYTSGSTGDPKGIMGHHSGAINRFYWMWKNYPFQANEICCQKTTINFVDSVWEMFGPLLQGIPVTILPTDAKDTNKLIHYLEENKITRLVLVPSLLNAIIDIAEVTGRKLPNLTVWTVSGETLLPETVRRFRSIFPDARLLNIYGSTEVAADVTCYEAHISDLEGGNSPIGYPIDNTDILILDDIQQPVEEGQEGELYVGGAGVAKGYYNREDLTRERFVVLPLYPDGVLFRTGDRGIKASDGLITFLGRKDRQVKLRGNRIELSEIEKVICKAGFAKDVIVVLDSNGKFLQLIAYVKADLLDNQREEATTNLRRLLDAALPKYMHPSCFAYLEDFPLNQSGKINRQAFPKVPEEALHDYRPLIQPQTEGQQLIVDVFKRELKIEKVGIDDSFITLGGDSLSVTGLLLEIEKSLGVNVPIADFLNNPTPKNLELLIERSSSVEPKNALLPISEKLGTPLFLIHPIIGVAFCYKAMAADFSSGSIIGINNPYIGKNGSFQSLEEMASFYMRAIIEFQPAGPYRIGGWSSGGKVAFEIARQMQMSGHQVEGLVFIDTHNIVIPADEMDEALRIQKVRSAAYLETQGINADSEQGHALLEEAVHNLKLDNNYTPHPYNGKTLLIKANLFNPGSEIDLGEKSPFNGWSGLVTSGITIERINAEHGKLMDEGNAGIIAKSVDAYFKSLERSAQLERFR